MFSIICSKFFTLLLIVAPTCGKGFNNWKIQNWLWSQWHVPVTIAWHSTKPHLPTYFQYNFANIMGVSTPTQVKYSTNMDDGCFSCGKDCLAFPIGCACAKQGDGDFAHYNKGLLKKIYIDQVIQPHLLSYSISTYVCIINKYHLLTWSMYRV